MKKKLVVLLLLLLTLSGCTKRFNVTDENNNKKSYVSNIICKPETSDLTKVYEENIKELKVDYEKLPICKNFKVNSGGYDGLWTSLFVKPLAWLIIKLGLLVKNYGLSIMILGILLRVIMMPLSLKSVKMSEKMKDAQKDLDKLERKYKGKEDKESLMAKSQEMMVIYKKYDIKPASGCLFTFLQLPIFFAFLEAIYRVPAFFEQKLWKFNLGQTPLEGFRVGNYWYLILVALIILATYYTFRNINTATGDEMQAKQMKTMSTFMVVFISITSFGLPTAIALYWIVSNGFTIIQNLIVKKGKL